MKKPRPEDNMSLRLRCCIALGSLCSLALFYTIHAQEAGSGPNLFTNDPRPKDAAQLTRTGARKTAIVSAVDRVKGAVVNIHSERTAASDAFAPPSSRKPMNGMGT